MRPAISSSLLLAIALLLPACAKQSPPNYYTEIPDRNVPNPDPYRWPPANVPTSGYCAEHGILTNWSADFFGVEQAVNRHNAQYHTGNQSPHWATILWKPYK
jgi:hypothetical protein